MENCDYCFFQSQSLSLLSFWASSFMELRPPNIAPQVTASFHFFFCPSGFVLFCASVWIVSINLCAGFLILSSEVSNVPLQVHSGNFSVQILYFYSNNIHLAYFIVSISWMGFSMLCPHFLINPQTYFNSVKPCMLT